MLRPFLNLHQCLPRNVYPHQLQDTDQIRLADFRLQPDSTYVGANIGSFIIFYHIHYHSPVRMIP